MIETPASPFWARVKTKIKWQNMLYIQYEKKLHHLTCIIKISSTRLCLHTQKKAHKTYSFKKVLQQ